MNPKLRRLLHAAFFSLLAAGTLAALFYAEEDWRGARAWNATKRDLKARGESIDSADFIPPPVPDDQNLAMAPLFVRMYRYKTDSRTRQLTFDHDSNWSDNKTFKTLSTIPWGESRRETPYPVNPGNWTTGHALDLSRVQAYYRQRNDFPQPPQPGTPADDVRLALTRYQPILDELTQAVAERPSTRFPVNWTLRPAAGIALPHYNTIQVLTSTLRLRAVAELAAGQAAAAQRDLALMFRLRQTMENDPFLIPALVDVTCLNLLMQPIWEGLAARQWTAEDLDGLRDRLRGIHILREYQQGVRSERAFFSARWPEDMQNFAQARSMAKEPPSTSGDEPALSPLDRRLWNFLPYWPRGWYEQNAAVASRYLQADWIDTVDPANHRLDFSRNQATAPAMKTIPATPYTLLVRIHLSVFGSIYNKFAQAQTILDQAVTACALEKYFLEQHAYPATLAALVPGYLDRVPDDVIDGAPMRYRLTVDGRYQLYSVGLDGHDDGGTFVWPADRTWRRASNPPTNGKPLAFPTPDRRQGDWIWQYAPAEPPDPPVHTSRLPSR